MPGDSGFAGHRVVPNPSYPIHIYGPVIAGAHVVSVPVHDCDQFLAELEAIIPRMTPRPKALIVNFPSNPTTQCVELPFLARLVETGTSIWIPPHPRPCLRRPRLRRIQLAPRCSRSRREGCCRRVLHAVEVLQHARLARGIHGRQSSAGQCAGAVEELLRLRDVYPDPGGEHSCTWSARKSVSPRFARKLPPPPRRLIEGTLPRRMGSAVPKATMFVWAKIPEAYQHLGSLEFSKLLLTEAGAAP